MCMQEKKEATIFHVNARKKEDAILTFVYSMCMQEKKEAAIFHVFAYKYKYA